MTEAETIIIDIIVDGETYPLDLGEFTARECGVLKRVGHIRGVVELDAAVPAGDLEVVVALALIAAKRAGVNLNAEKLLDGKLGGITLAFPESKDEKSEDPESEDPPTTAEMPGDCGIPASPESTE